MSKIPINLEKIRKEDLNKENLRAAIIAELDAVNLYEQMAVGFYKKGVIVKACGFLSGLS